jgi:hypothetical protein
VLVGGAGDPIHQSSSTRALFDGSQPEWRQFLSFITIDFAFWWG